MNEPLPQEVIEEIIRQASPGGRAFLVGGQALNFWAERYAERAPELRNYGPYSTKDVDFFGTAQAARKLAGLLGGKVRVPSGDDHSPQSAVVEAKVLGHDVSIDFLWNIKGPPSDQLERQMVAVNYPIHVSGGALSHVPISVMHPLHCLQSRAANVIDLGRRDAVSRRQLDAAPIVLREYISEALGPQQAPDPKRARVALSVMNSLAHYLTSDIWGAKVHRFTENNPLEVLRAFRHDPRLDERNRETQVQRMIDNVTARQARDQHLAAQAAMARGQGM